MLAFREDGDFDMTQAAKPFDEDPYNFRRTAGNQQYMEALCVNFTEEDLIVVKKGNGDRRLGSKLAAFFTR